MSDWEVISSSVSDDKLSQSESEDGFKFVEGQNHFEKSKCTNKVKNFNRVVSQWLQNQTESDSMKHHVVLEDKATALNSFIVPELSEKGITYESKKTVPKALASRPVNAYAFTIKHFRILLTKDDAHGIFTLFDHPSTWYNIAVSQRLNPIRSGLDELKANACILQSVSNIMKKDCILGVLQIALWTLLFRQSCARESMWFWEKLEKQVFRTLNVGNEDYIVSIKGDLRLFIEKIGHEGRMINNRLIIKNSEAFFIIEAERGARLLSFEEGSRRMDTEMGGIN
ncbi:hypothetical protein EG329_000981 [Mollisiaceae sp. DMI_Dod_QoI]|nr:hypothetical protein EG329_000981 [Helotiales sp. DMI_Dod_QoI]